MSAETPAEYLARMGKAGGGPHDIATAALMLAAMDHPETDLKPFTEHLAEIAAAAKAEAAFARSPDLAARGLSDLLQGRYGYGGDQLRFDSPDNADMISVIVNRRGLPVALGILYIHAARAAGAKAFGLSAPHHFLLMIQAGGGETVIDPFNGGKTIEHERTAKPPALAEPWYVRHYYERLSNDGGQLRIHYWHCFENQNNDVVETEQGGTDFSDFTFTDEDDR